LPGSGQGGGAGGVVAKAVVWGRRPGGLGRDGLLVEACGYRVEVFDLAQSGVLGALAGVGGLLLAAEDGQQLAVQGGQALALLELRGDVLARRVAFGQEFQAAPCRRPCLGKATFLQQQLSECGLGQGEPGGEVDGLLVLGDGSVHVPLVMQGHAQVVVDLGKPGLAVQGLGVAADGAVGVPLGI
jgi:hypothetical protein